MKKVIKIGFPILCVAVIGGTFILLNKTTERINRNKLKEDETDIVAEEPILAEPSNEIQQNTATSLDVEEARVQEVKNKAKAIELVKKLAPPTSNVYYTNEGTVGNKYLVAIRDNDTTDAKIYYIVDIESEELQIYVK